jgi:nitrogen fixation/metabolism regulation signal transduction histidine kinase
MSPITIDIKKWLTASIVGLLFISLIASLFIASNALQDSTRFENLYSILLLVNIIFIFALLLLIALNLRRLIKQVRRRRAGARLTMQLVGLLIVLSIVPVTIVYYFSLQFLHQRLDSWFDVNVEQALTDALTLSRTILNDKKKEALRQTESIAYEIDELFDEEIPNQISDLRNRFNANELTVFNSKGQIIGYSSIDTERLTPAPISKALSLRLKKSKSYVGLEKTIDEDRFDIRVIVKMRQGDQTRSLYALFPIPESINQLTNNITTSFTAYRERAYLYQPLKFSFTLVLSLVLLLSIFSAVWMAFFAARRLVAPLNDLAEGTEAVASGDYKKQLPISHFDELGDLVHSFNEMTRKIALATDAVKKSERMAENQRAYLEAVLKRLSSGVISLGPAYCLRTANSASDEILGVSLSQILRRSLTELEDTYPTAEPLFKVIRHHLEDVADWREEISLFGSTGRQILLCRGTRLQSIVEGERAGNVIVFDDVTTLIQAQRESAWSEVARRLAHEIKNPLTPIQLSAERLRHKYLGKIADMDLLDRMTQTIIHQVEAMKEMVNEFSDYARIQNLRWQNVNVNELIKDILELYLQSPIQYQLNEDLPTIKADEGRLRQVLHNLIKNGLEAVAHKNDAQLLVSTDFFKSSTVDCIELRVQDNGTGVPQEMLNKIFEPYVTTKPKGTGLGLAIVKKIIEEHGGKVWIENYGGACIIIRLPLRS